MHPERVREIPHRMHAPSSIDRPWRESEDTNLVDMVTDEYERSALWELQERAVSEHLRQYLCA